MGETRKDWLERRKRGIGASESAAAAGVSEWSTPLELYLRKRGEIPVKEDNDAMRRGRMLEPLIVEEFSRTTGLKISEYPCDLQEHPEHGELIFATPDAKISKTVGLECKSTTWRMAERLGAENTGDVPIDWMCQAQQQMACCGWDRVHFAVWIDVQTLKTFVVERDEEAIEMLIEADLSLVARIRHGERPDYDQEALNLDLVRRLYPEVDERSLIHLPKPACEWWSRHKQLSQEAKAAQKEAEMAKAQALAEMGNAAYGILDNGRMIRRRMVERSPYTVEPKPYVESREVKIPLHVSRMIQENRDGQAAIEGTG